MEFWIKIYWKVESDKCEEAISLCNKLMKILEKGSWSMNTIWKNEDYETYRKFEESIVDEIVEKHWWQR